MRTPIAALALTIAATEIDTAAIPKIKQQVKAAADALTDRLERYPTTEMHENSPRKFG